MDLFPFWPGCKLILHLLVLRILVALQWHPLRLLLSFLWRRWTLLCEYCTRAWIIFYSVTSEYNSAFVICEILVPTPNSWDDRCPLMTRSERFCLLSLLHRSPLFFVSDFCQLPCRNLLEFFPFFAHCCFRIWHFHCFRHRNKLVHEIAVVQSIDSFPCDVVFMILM